MSIIGSNILAGAAGSGVSAYEIEQSIKFDDNRSAYLYRTPASAGNRQTWTYSGWFKRGRTEFRQQLLNSTSGAYIEFVADNTIRLEEYTGSVQWTLKTNAIYRDNSAWYHIVVAFDSTVSSPSSDRIKVWINGEQVTSFSSSSYPALNHNSQMNTASEHRIGRYYTSSSDYLDGYLAEVNFIDGSALDHEDFGEFDNNGVWRPIKYAGSYTGNSYYLEFVQGALGTDSSGLGNNWTTSELWEEIGTPNYRGNWIGSTSGSPYSGSWENVFNGDATVGSNYVSAYNNTTTLTFSTALSGVIEVLASNGANEGGSGTMQVSLSDGSTYDVANVTRLNTPFYSFGSKSNITSITITSSGGGNHGTILGAIRVDGNLLANISAKANYVNMADTPTTNWCTLNPLDVEVPSGTLTIDNGNLDTTSSSTNSWKSGAGTLGVSSGKWYWEATLTNESQNNQIGVINAFQEMASLSNYFSAESDGWALQSNDNLYNGGSTGERISDQPVTGDIIGVALDADSGKLWFAVNNSWQSLQSGQSAGDPAAGTNAIFTNLSGYTLKPAYALYSAGDKTTFNFGQRAFAYTPPTGYKALNTANLPAPDIADGSQYFNTVLWTGNGSSSSRTISGVGFQPDFTWIKGRSYSGSGNRLMDAVRGAGQMIQTNSTGTEFDDSANVPSFASDGFTLTTTGTSYNASGQTYVAWNWDANGSGSSNTDGSITSTVSANPTAGFSIVGYTGTGANATVGHGLGVAPTFLAIKNRDTNSSWMNGHQGLGSWSNVIFFDLTSAKVTDSTVFNGTAPTSTVFSVGTNSQSNKLNDDMIAYCFAEVEGYSKFGSYTGNGSTDGPFIYTGFRPAWLMIKDTTGSLDAWYINDSKRNAYNVVNGRLMANLANDEATALNICDFTANGFKIRTNDSGWNTSSSTYIFATFSENPFGGSGVSPATAR